MTEQRRHKKRDALLLLLLLLLLITGVAIIYFNGPSRKGKNDLQVNHPITRNTGPYQPGTDSATSSVGNAPYDSSLHQYQNPKTGIMMPVTVDTTNSGLATSEKAAETKEEVIAPVVSEEIASDRFKKKEFINVSTEDDLVCLFDPVKKNLYFHPSSNEWGKVYLIYPSPDPKSLLRRNLIYPDYAGMIYPIYRKGMVSYNGTNKDAVAVRINARASKSKSYVIQAKSNPDYFIFGDYDDKSRWYIYENGKVRRFSPPSGFDAGLTEKL